MTADLMHLSYRRMKGVPLSSYLRLNYKMENRRVTQLGNIIALKAYGPSDLIIFSLDVT